MVRFLYREVFKSTTLAGTPMGRFWKTDSNSNIQNDCDFSHVDKISHQVLAKIKNFIEEIKLESLHSCYITGSVGRGFFKPGQSDLDIFMVFESEDLDKADRELSKLEKELNNSFKEYSDIQIESWPWSYVFPDNHLFSIASFVIKTHNLCFWGDSLSFEIPNLKISAHIPNDDVFQIASDIKEAREELLKDSSKDNVKYWCRRILKNIARASFGIVCLDIGKFSRDIDLCCRSVIEYFPEKKSEIKNIEKLIKYPTDDYKELEDILDGYGKWIIKKAEAWLRNNNPERVEQMTLQFELKENS